MRLFAVTAVEDEQHHADLGWPLAVMPALFSPGRGWIFRDSTLCSHNSNSNPMHLINKILCDKYSTRSIYIMYYLIMI